MVTGFLARLLLRDTFWLLQELPPSSKPALTLDSFSLRPVSSLFLRSSSVDTERLEGFFFAGSLESVSDFLAASAF